MRRAPSPPVRLPHYRIIKRPDQVRIFETEYLDSLNRPTLSLQMAACVRKANRILPAGLEAKLLHLAGLGELVTIRRYHPRQQLHGRFGADTDRIRLLDAPVDLRVKVEALFQVIKPSHLPPLFPLPIYQRR